MFDALMRTLDAAQRRRPDCSRAAILLGASGVQAQLLQKAAYWLALQGWSGAALWASCANRWATGLTIHPSAKIGFDVDIPAPTGIVIGENVCVGDRVTLGPGVMLLASAQGSPVIEDDVVLGASARIVGNVRVPAGTVVATGAVWAEGTDGAAVPAPLTVVAATTAAPLKAAATALPAQVPEAPKPEKIEAEKPVKPEIDPAVKELVRVVREQNAVIAKLNEAVGKLGGETIEPEKLPKISGKAAGVSTRRARHHRPKKTVTTTETK